jgi:hypothetical protein
MFGPKAFPITGQVASTASDDLGEPRQPTAEEVSSSSGSYDVTLMVLTFAFLPVVSPSLCKAAITC